MSLLRTRILRGYHPSLKHRETKGHEEVPGRDQTQQQRQHLLLLRHVNAQLDQSGRVKARD